MPRPEEVREWLTNHMPKLNPNPVRQIEKARKYSQIWQEKRLQGHDQQISHTKAKHIDKNND